MEMRRKAGGGGSVAEERGRNVEKAGRRGGKARGGVSGDELE